MSATPKYQKQPSGEWLGFPDLRLEDIEHESFKLAKFASQALVDDRKGRVCLLIDQGFYSRFLQAVKRKFGNISHVNVDKAVLEAVKSWVEGVEAT